MSDLDANDWVSLLGEDEKRAAIHALHDLVFGGEFAGWMDRAGPSMPFAAAREYDGAVAAFAVLVTRVSKARRPERSLLAIEEHW